MSGDKPFFHRDDETVSSFVKSKKHLHFEDISWCVPDTTDIERSFIEQEEYVLFQEMLSKLTEQEQQLVNNFYA